MIPFCKDATPGLSEFAKTSPMGQVSTSQVYLVLLENFPEVFKSYKCCGFYAFVLSLCSSRKAIAHTPKFFVVVFSMKTVFI